MISLLTRVGLGAVGGGGWIAIAALVVAASASSAWVSWRVCEAGWQNARANALEQALAERNAAQQRADKLAADYLQAKQQRRVVYREVIREIPTMVDRDACRVTDDGMRQLACAIDPAQCAAERGATVPAAANP